MTELLKICGGAVIVAVSAFLLREFGWRGAGAFSILGLVIFIGLLTDGVSRAVRETSVLASAAGVGSLAKEILKVMGVSYIFGISADVSSELGEKTLSSVLLAVGRVEIILIVMPYFLEVVRYSTELIGV